MTDHAVAHATFSLERTYPVAPAQVFAAWADPEIKRLPRHRGRQANRLQLRAVAGRSPSHGLAHHRRIPPLGNSTRLILTEQGAFLDGLEQPAWREQGTGEWLDALGLELGTTPK
jgi:hypothetical protein